MRFRPCIDLHEGCVKQIVGGSLSDDPSRSPVVNFVAAQPPSYYAGLYRADGLTGGHIIMLGPGNEEAAAEALAAWPGGMQLGGGITPENAPLWLARGASAVIVTSYAFREGEIDTDRLETIRNVVGKERLVLDLSCRRQDGSYYIVTGRWTQFTRVRVEPATLDWLAGFCSEFLVHAADVEGLCSGIEDDLVSVLGAAAPVPTTYAGGVRSMADVERVRELGRGRLDITVGSALDLFGGTGVRYKDMVRLNRSGHESPGALP